ncbi:hypothetical protein C8R44DRAFT_956017 [Mycena epipterygia]|nr:hypothetical protein C8R44DRAFT_956017 [Mycena epipterygia]
MSSAQRTFHIFSADDDRSPRRSANAFEHAILQSVVDRVELVLRVPEIQRLCDDGDLILGTNGEEEPVSDDALAFTGLPQVDIVEGLAVEGRVVGSPDVPETIKLRIELKAQRFYHLCTLAATVGTDHPRYKTAFVWMILVLMQECMHLVQGPEEALTLTPKCVFAPVESVVTTLRRSPEVEVPTDVDLRDIILVCAKRKVPEGGALIWRLEGYVHGPHLLDAFVDGTANDIARTLVQLRHHIRDEPGEHVDDGIWDATLSNMMLEKDDSDLVDVFDAHDADRFPEIAKVLRYRELHAADSDSD